MIQAKVLDKQLDTQLDKQLDKQLQASKNSHEVVIYYKFVNIDNPDQLRNKHWQMCNQLGLSGRVLIGAEGINGTLEGSPQQNQKYINWVHSQEGFEDIVFKKSYSQGDSFPKLTIKARKEIVALGLPKSQNYDPKKLTAKFLSAQELHQWLKQKRDFIILDVRNDYEVKLGKFTDSVCLPGLKNFRDAPKLLPRLEYLKNKTVLTVCTGGIRCERISGLLLQQGFKDVYQLQDGIHAYMQKYPNEDFLGKLYVFDKRMRISFSGKSTLISKCYYCSKPSDNIVDTYIEGKRVQEVCCQECIRAGIVQLD